MGRSNECSLQIKLKVDASGIILAERGPLQEAIEAAEKAALKAFVESDFVDDRRAYLANHPAPAPAPAPAPVPVPVPAPAPAFTDEPDPPFVSEFEASAVPPTYIKEEEEEEEEEEEYSSPPPCKKSNN